ncbi:hypothetical protein ES705_49176 [subsurface metagenome]
MSKIKSYGIILVVALSAILGTGIVFAQQTIEISIAPATLNLDKVDDKCVTVHADIDYDEVDCDTLTLNDISVDSTKADDRGDLVAKFDREAIAGLVVEGEDTLTLTLIGETNEEESFTGTDTIRVKR